MTVRIDAGFEGDLALVIDEGSGGVEVTLSGTYAHVDMSPVLGTTYNELAAELQAQLNGAAGLSDTYDVTFGAALGPDEDGNASGGPGYTIDSTGTYSVSFTAVSVAAEGTRMRRLLGYSGNQGSTGGGVTVSDRRPWYTIVAANDCKASPATDDYEPDGMGVGDYSMGGAIYGVAVVDDPDDPGADLITFSDFTLTLESKAATFRRSAGTYVPWTWQHFWRHCRNVQPFLVVDDIESTVHYLRGEGASFQPSRHSADYDDYWDLEFRTFMAGRL